MCQHKGSMGSQTPYLEKVRQQLNRSYVLLDTPCQHVDGGNKPEIELQTDKELLLPSFTICKSDKELALFEPSINALRISFKVSTARSAALPFRWHEKSSEPQRLVTPCPTWILPICSSSLWTSWRACSDESNFNSTTGEQRHCDCFVERRLRATTFHSF